MTINKVSNSFRNSLLPHYHVFSPYSHETCTGPTPSRCAVIALCECPYGPSSDGILIASTSAMSPPPSAVTTNIVDRHITARVCHHPSRLPRHLDDKAPRPVTPLMPLPSLRDVGIPIPPKRPCHDDDYSTSSSMLTSLCFSSEHHKRERNPIATLSACAILCFLLWSLLLPHVPVDVYTFCLIR